MGKKLKIQSYESNTIKSKDIFIFTAMLISSTTMDFTLTLEVATKVNL